MGIGCKSCAAINSKQNRIKKIWISSLVCLTNDKIKFYILMTNFYFNCLQSKIICEYINSISLLLLKRTFSNRSHKSLKNLLFHLFFSQLNAKLNALHNPLKNSKKKIMSVQSRVCCTVTHCQLRLCLNRLSTDKTIYQSPFVPSRYYRQLFFFKFELCKQQHFS